MCKISVIVPIYNTEKCLSKCIDSIINQSLKDIEIICIDDCSTDKSVAIIEQYTKNDKRIKLLKNDNNSGASYARNKGINFASGEYIGFVDSDDFIALDFYEKLYIKAIEFNADAAKGKMRCIGSKNSLIRECSYDRNDKIEKNYAYFYDSFTTAIYKRKFILENNIFFPVGINFFEDPYFNIFAGFNYKKLVLCNDAYYFYADREKSLSKSINENNILAGLNAMYEIINYMNANKTPKDHYIVIYSYIMSQFTSILSNIFYNKKIISLCENLFLKSYSECMYKEECINEYFDAKRYIQKKCYVNSLRKNILKG